MPRNKDLKRLVRSRMRKTGEAYTAARAQIVKKHAVRQDVKAAAAAATAAPDVGLRVVRPAEYATLAGMSDEAIKAKTGCTWERWVRTLDQFGAAELPHREIAAMVRDKWKTDGWWAQSVAVGYERIKGLRARGQRRDGSYRMSKSRTYGVPLKTLFGAWADARTRRRWLDDAAVKVRAATPPKYMRLDWKDGGIVAVVFLAKGRGKSVVSVEHSNLPDRESSQRLKDYWGGRLDVLGDVLKAGSA